MTAPLCRAGTVLAALTLLVSGCADDPGASGSADAGAGPDVPAYAQDEGRAGAEKFAGYWVDTLNRATESGDTAQMRALAAKSCAACLGFADQIEGVYDAGGRIEGGAWDVAQAVHESGTTAATDTLLVTVRIDEQQVFANADAQPEKFDSGEQSVRMTLAWVDDAYWQVADLTTR